MKSNIEAEVIKNYEKESHPDLRGDAIIKTETGAEVITPESSRFSIVKTFLDMEKNLRIQKLKESIEQQRELHKLKLEVAVADRDAKVADRDEQLFLLDLKKYELEYWKKKLQDL